MDSQNPPEKEKKFKNTKSLKNIINNTKLTKKQSEKFPSYVPKEILDGLWLPSTCSKSSNPSTSKEIFKIVPHDLKENKNCEMIVNPLINYLEQDDQLINEIKTEELETKQIELEEKRLKKQNVRARHVAKSGIMAKKRHFKILAKGWKTSVMI